MSAAGRNGTPAPTASDLAAALGDAGFVRLVASPNGDALAATGVLATSLGATGTPFQASVADPYEPRVGATQADYTVAIGDLDVAADAALSDDVAASATAFDVAGELAAAEAGNGDGPDADGNGPDPILALAGTIAAGEIVPPVVEAAEAAGVERRPGVALPVTDLADGLAHSTLFRAPFSGDAEAASAAIEPLDLADDREGGDRRRLASLVALDASSSGSEGSVGGATERAAEAVERSLRPFVGGPFETVGGFADVLDAATRERPGVALSLALGYEGARDEALAAWREHGTAAHAALTDGETARYDGLFVVRAASMPVGTVARLAADYESPEPVALAIADGEAAIHAIDGTDAAAALAVAIEGLDGSASGAGERGHARFTSEDDSGTDDGDGTDWIATGDEIVAAVREAL